MMYSNDEKRETMDYFLRLLISWRNGDDPGRRELYVVLKCIASDYRARDKIKIGETLKEMRKAVELAEGHRTPEGQYDGNRVWQVGTRLLGSWSVWEQAMERFERETTP